MSLVGHWPLDEDSGSAIDYSGNGNDGTVDGPLQGVTGVVGTGAYFFDGFDDVIKASGTELDTTTNEWSISLWIKRNGSFGNQQKFFGQTAGDGSYTGGQVNVQFYTDDRLYVAIGSVGTATIGNTVVDDTDWHHVSVTFDNGTFTSYLDGNEDGSASVGNPHSVSSDPLWWGAAYNEYFDGTIDECRFYDRVLTQSEVQYLYDVSNEAYFESSVKQ